LPPTSTPSTLKEAAEAIWAARQVFTLGVGVNNSNASNFTYLASTGMVQFHAIPRPAASPPTIWPGPTRDVLIAMTCKPYRREVVEAVRIAREQGVTVIGVSDSAASPDHHRPITASSSASTRRSSSRPRSRPSPFWKRCCPSSSPSASDEIVERVEQFHRRRHELGIYTEER
jgi:DNA-binding MurR/RpiR family transcriptional regulator